MKPKVKQMEKEMKAAKTNGLKSYPNEPKVVFDKKKPKK